jgi:hypothetical protein
MPIFPRRQLQRMLSELGPWLTKPKATDLVKRLDNRDPSQAIPAEYELGLAWAVSKVAHLHIDPNFGGKIPDLLSNNLFPDKPIVIEITALSDDAISGQPSMENTAKIINRFADTIIKKASKNLHYTFLETHGYRPVKLKTPIGPWTHENRYYRKRLTSWNFKLTREHEARLRKWLADGPPHQPLQINGEGTSVVVSWKKLAHPSLNTFSSMPSEVHDLTNNPVYDKLKEKEDQLRFVPDNYLKCIVLGDAGCTLLRQPTDFDSSERTVSGKEIVWKFLQGSSVDRVCIFSPRRRYENSPGDFDNPRLWHIYIFEKKERSPGYIDPMGTLNDLLPRPYLHAYQARSWMEQRFLAPQARGQYLPLSVSGGPMGATAKISARALIELLAGRMNATQFKNWITGDRNQFEVWLSKGYAISDIRFESQGADRDDDYVVLKMDIDPNASKLQIPDKLKSDPDIPQQS